ncbi:enoyl-CoA hydratase [Variovorax sp. PBL-E5]|uniref:enoyl-CoA hydratase n=1 Tax=Variovorax sp. PBL-E5 TaxID=434014 RepID=UPI0013165A5E|nr:enoyl-CoA hydratase [Variovorax sp. PBL-E5]VTU39947.1 2,3-dehydroadipyl-CoA hydratase [Variovorax sp. PBL-E5]
MADAEPVLLRVERPLAGCALLTLDRPGAMNALSIALRRQLASAFEALAADQDTRVVVLTGAGRAFCAGLDLKELGSSPDTGASLAPTADIDPVSAMARFEGPIIGAINGPAITGGFELALACDLIVASTAATFADTHARVGVMPGWGLSQRLPRLIGAGRAKEMSFTGNFIDASTAAAWGLVNRVVPPEDLLPQALGFAADMLSTVPGTLQAFKRLIDDGLGGTLAEGLALERQRSRAWASTIDRTDIERRRQQIADRGRTQAGPPPGLRE